eukprot:COSAG06_NODE_1433_length_9477_cov_69.462301_6_plen_55_part_00
MHAGELEDRGWTVVLDVLPFDLDERAGRRRARAWLLGVSILLPVYMSPPRYRLP